MILDEWGATAADDRVQLFGIPVTRSEDNLFDVAELLRDYANHATFTDYCYSTGVMKLLDLDKSLPLSIVEKDGHIWADHRIALDIIGKYHPVARTLMLNALSEHLGIGMDDEMFREVYFIDAFGILVKCADSVCEVADILYEHCSFHEYSLIPEVHELFRISDEILVEHATPTEAWVSPKIAIDILWRFYPKIRLRILKALTYMNVPVPETLPPYDTGRSGRAIQQPGSDRHSGRQFMFMTAHPSHLGSYSILKTR